MRKMPDLADFSPESTYSRCIHEHETYLTIKASIRQSQELLVLADVTAISGHVASLLATRWAGSSAWYALDGAEERPVRKALPEEPEGRGSESRPVHHKL